MKIITNDTKSLLKLLPIQHSLILRTTLMQMLNQEEYKASHGGKLPWK